MAERRRDRLWMSALGAVLLAAAPLGAQTTAPATNSATPAPTPAPADGSLIGPPQLRDFNLNGTVTRPAEPVATPTPAPAPARATPRSAEAAPREASPRSDAPTVRAEPPLAGPDRDSSSDTVAIDLPPPTPAAPAAVGPGFGETSPETPPAIAPSADEGAFPWPWLLAALVAALGGGFLLWRKRHAEPRRVAYAGVSEFLSPEPQPLAKAPSPRAVVEPRAAPQNSPRATAPGAVVDGGIVSSALRPSIGFELHPIRAETDDQRGAALLFDVIVVNTGHAPARDVLVEAQLLNAGPKQDEQIGRFFREPVGKGERLPLIPPMGRISIKTRLAISPDQMQPIEVEGRLLFVPLVAFNALYRWSGGELQNSASFLVGRGQQDGGKMAPFRLDQGARSWTGLGARPHSMGLQR